MTLPKLPDLSHPSTHVGGRLEPVFWQALRADQPLAWHESTPGFWVVSRYRDTAAICRDPRRYSSAGGNVLATLLAGGDTASGRMLPISDDPWHRQMRAKLWPAFTPETLRRLEARIEDKTTALVARAGRAGACDFVGDVAAHIPTWAICELLGVPQRDRAFVAKHTGAALASDAPGQTAAQARLAKSEILLYFARLARQRRSSPGEDLVSLLTSQRCGLTDDEAVFNCYSLIIGGQETTKLAMSGAALALATHPDQWAALKDGVPTVAAVDEVLRWTTPAMHLGRTATEDIPLHGQVIRAGDIVTAWTVSANFDDAEFVRPERFDLMRKPNRHLAFANGPHFCLGAQLARIQIQALLRSLRSMVNRIEVIATPRPVYSTFLRGFAALPVRLHA